ncbi:hypothetical protein BS47DRAFT_1389848 [Hydnum rufescens UP504]|uniref:Uncharacterized protein n=1 Tax=Hydnum rufescens UP504 TaxID=1448309 RepID=A0A9P6B630_9AGAM|nr:hypothetical protein BS47DRAFT_1389848 [Hydnum rufescens UP504]
MPAEYACLEAVQAGGKCRPALCPVLPVYHHYHHHPHHLDSVLILFRRRPSVTALKYEQDPSGPHHSQLHTQLMVQTRPLDSLPHIVIGSFPPFALFRCCLSALEITILHLVDARKSRERSMEGLNITMTSTAFVARLEGWREYTQRPLVRETDAFTSVRGHCREAGPPKQSVGVRDLGLAAAIHLVLPYTIRNRMANLVRSKPGSDWTLNELDSCHITLNQVDPLTFFGVPVGETIFAVALGGTVTTFRYWLIKDC